MRVLWSRRRGRSVHSCYFSKYANGKLFSVCGVLNPYASAAPVRAALTIMFSLGQPFDTKIDGGQQYTYWTTKFMDKEIKISFIDTTPMEEPGVNIAVTLIQ
jgi:hypothetical protein